LDHVDPEVLLECHLVDRLEVHLVDPMNQVDPATPMVQGHLDPWMDLVVNMTLVLTGRKINRRREKRKALQKKPRKRLI